MLEPASPAMIERHLAEDPNGPVAGQLKEQVVEPHVLRRNGFPVTGVEAASVAFE